MTRSVGYSGCRYGLHPDREPGDFFAVTTVSDLGNFIHIAEILASGKGADYEHAALYLGGPHELILEAEPHGAVIRPFHYAETLTLWSSGIKALELSVSQQSAVMATAYYYLGTPYSFADYLAIAAHKWHFPAPGLQDYIADDRHMICSQLVDATRLRLRSNFFHDGRWPGYVMPVDIANLIYAKGNM